MSRRLARVLVESFCVFLHHRKRSAASSPVAAILRSRLATRPPQFWLWPPQRKKATISSSAPHGNLQRDPEWLRRRHCPADSWFLYSYGLPLSNRRRESRECCDSGHSVLQRRVPYSHFSGSSPFRADSENARHTSRNGSDPRAPRYIQVARIASL